MVFLWLVAVVFVLVTFKALMSLKHFRELPIPGPPPLPIVGNVLPMAAADSFMVLASEWLNKYGPVIQVFIFGKRVVLIGKNPEAVKDIFTNSAYIKGIVAKDFYPLLGKSGMIFSDGEIWSRVRKTCTGSFHKDYLRIFEEPIRKCTRILVDQLQQNISTKTKLKTVDMDEYFVKVTLDIMGQTMLSNDFQSLTCPNSQIHHYVEIFLRETMASVQNPLHFFLVPTSSFAYKKSVQYLQNYVQHIIDVRIKARNENHIEHNDLLDLLLDAQNPDSGVGLTKLEVQEQVLTFLLAGHETGAHTLAFCVSLVTKHPHVAAKIRQELDEVLGKEDVIPSYEQCIKLNYLTAVIKETLRMFPIAPIIIRQLDEDRKVAGYDLKKGQLVGIDLVSTHYNPETWEEPDIFNPERFLQKTDSEGTTLLPHEFSPFGHGKRSCIGQNFAMLEMRMILAIVLRKFRFQHVPLIPVGPKETVTLRPKGGLKMTVWPIVTN